MAATDVDVDLRKRSSSDPPAHPTTMATAELPFDLIEAKLAPPAVRADTVVKSELIDRLRASEAGVVTVVAPAGFGKTTLLGHLAQRDDRSFATVALDERDNDPVVLLRYVAAALDRVAHVPASVFEALSTPGRSVWSICIPRVCAALSAVTDPVALVLDDLHFVSDPTSLDAVAALLDHVPEGSQVVVSCREEPPLPLARLRAQGRLLEIGADELRLNAEEAATLLRNASVDLDDSAVAELTDRTEGWAAGLYLAALSLRAGGSAADGAWTFGGDDRFVADYLRLELLSRLTAEDVQFLTRSSVLDRMCGGLCDAVLGRHDSAARARVARAVQSLSGPTRSHPDVVPVPPPVPRSAAQRARSSASPRSPPSSTAGRWTGVGPTGLPSRRCITPTRPGTPTP